MGRKADFHLKAKKGPGRKAKKQQEPVFKFEDEDAEKKLSRRQRVRAKKRELTASKATAGQAKRQKKEIEDDAGGSDGEELDSSSMSDMEEEEETIPSKGGKAKDVLFGGDDDSELSGDQESYDEEEEDSDSDNEDIEKMAQKLDQRKKEDEAAADAEMDETAGKIELQIPTLEDVEKELKETPDLANIQARIKDTAFVLTDFSKRREEGRSRKEYLAIFLKDLCTYYSYNEFLMDKLMDMFGPTELVEFLEANERPRPVTIRTNTLKSRRKVLATALIDQGVDVDVINWSKVGLIVMQTPGNVALGATPQYLAGHYLIQGASSFLPVMAMAPKPGEKVLDMCAAPGGKSTHIAALMKNTGLLLSNDVHVDRVKALVGNFHRMGITNTIITAMDGKLFSKKMPRTFDRVLLDAPCTGTGVISKDESVKTSKDAKDFQRCSHLQRELLLSAIDSTHKFDGESGYVVYSTCSIMVEENEEVIQYALRKRHVKLVQTGLEVGRDGFVHYRGKTFDSSMELCKRIYPHAYNMDGFFVAKLQKLADGAKATTEEQKRPIQKTSNTADNGETNSSTGSNESPAIQTKTKKKAAAKGKSEVKYVAKSKAKFKSKGKAKSIGKAKGKINKKKKAVGKKIQR